MIAQNNKNLQKAYVIAIVLCLLELFIYLLLFDTGGTYFYIGQVDADPGIDFYQSIMFSEGLDPYRYAFPYPPLTVLLCNFLSLFCISPAHPLPNPGNTSQLLKEVYSSGFAIKNLFYLLSLLVIVLLFYFIYISLNNEKISEVKRVTLSIFLIVNSGLLCGIVRGNFIVLSLLLLLIFIMFYNDDNKIVKNLALLSLAIAFNIKSYAAVFGLLLLYNRQYKDCIKAAIISLVLFIVPFYFLRGGFTYNLQGFLKQLLGFGSPTPFYISGRAIPIFVLERINRSPNVIGQLSIKILPQIFAMAVSIALFVKGFFLKQNWKRILAITLIMILLPVNFGYIFSFMLLPILFFLIEEDNLTRSNVLYLVAFLFLTAPFVFTKMNFTSTRLILCNVMLLFLSGMLIFEKP